MATKKNNNRSTKRKIRKSRKNTFGSTFSKGKITIPSHTPLDIQVLSRGIQPAKLSSYTPTINDKLVSMKSIPRSKLQDCNNKAAFEMREPLKIGIGEEFFGKSCVPYFKPSAIKVLLKNLTANKHVNIKDVIPPIQIDSNCWFNTMFTTFFISDKGRKFFHYFRQLMIEGKQANGEEIPNKLKNGFALLNFAIDAALTGNEYAYELNTNNIIREIYDAVPDSYHARLPYIRNVKEAGNPIRYYSSIINYLNHGNTKTPIELLYIGDCERNWKERINREIKQKTHLPHVVVIEIFDESNGTSGNSGLVTNKPLEFTSNRARYMLDSCIVRDKQQQHFCATLTCNGREIGYDGMSFHRLVPMEWKKYINSNFEWSFEGSNNTDGTPLKWNFTHGYQMLLYYRTR